MFAFVNLLIGGRQRAEWVVHALEPHGLSIVCHIVCALRIGVNIWYWWWRGAEFTYRPGSDAALASTCGSSECAETLAVTSHHGAYSFGNVQDCDKDTLRIEYKCVPSVPYVQGTKPTVTIASETICTTDMFWGVATGDPPKLIESPSQEQALIHARTEADGVCICLTMLGRATTCRAGASNM